MSMTAEYGAVVFFVSLPVIVAATGLLMLCLSCRDSASKRETALNKSLAVYFMLTSGGWTGIFLFFTHSVAFTAVLPVYAFCVLAIPAGLYGFIGQMEDGKRRVTWRSQHSAVPCLTAVAALTIILFFPRLTETFSHRILYTLRFLTSLLYFTATVALLYRHQFEQQLAMPGSRLAPALWTRIFVGMMFIHLFNAAAPVIIAREQYPYAVFTGSLLIVLQMAVLLYNTLCRHYEMVKPVRGGAEEAPETEKTPLPSLAASPVFALTRRNFEAFMRKNRLYANPTLSLDDLTGQLGVSQPALTAFIRQTYGTNFRGFLNAERLREVERLRALPSGTGVLLADIVARAGFGSYRSYQRAKNAFGQGKTGEREGGS
jgi:AraC-like DNA-binding protein